MATVPKGKEMSEIDQVITGNIPWLALLGLVAASVTALIFH